MKRFLLIAAIMTTLTGNLSGSPEQSPPAHKQEVVKQEPRDVSPVTVVIDNAQRSEPAQTPKPEPPRDDTTPQWVLVVVGIITAGFICWQSWETRKSAQAVRDSIPLQQQAANAAAKSADALVASERAWITVKLDWSPGYSGLFSGDHTEYGITTPHHICTVRMTYKNEGKTPAWIIQRRAVLEIVEPIPQFPPLDKAEAIAVGIESLAPGEEKYVDTPLQCTGRQTMDNLAVIYGIVKYRVAVEKSIGESIFGYSISIGGTILRVLENEEWNQNT